MVSLRVRHQCGLDPPRNESSQRHAGDHDGDSDQHRPAEQVIERDEGESNLEDSAPCDLSIRAEILFNTSLSARVPRLGRSNSLEAESHRLTGG